MHLPRIGLITLVFAGFALGTGQSQAVSIDDIKILMQAGSLQAALLSTDDYLQKHPGDAQARFLKGIILTEQDQIQDAIEAFAALSADYPELPEPYNNLAVLHAATGDYVKARDALLMAINTHPSYATAHENLGDIYAKMAGLAYHRALQLDRANASAKAKLALMRDLISVSEPPIE